MKLKVLGVCGGNGVMLHPLRKYLIGNKEPRRDYKTPQDIQWRLNFPEVTLDNKLDNGMLLQAGNIPNIIVGHPTCGHSSALAYSRGKKLGDAKADMTMQLFINSVTLLKPYVFLFENLNSLFKSFPENEFDASFSDYDLVKYRVSMAAFGNSQVSRERLVVVGVRKGKNPFKTSDFKLLKKENIRLKLVKELESSLEYPNKDLCHVREADNTIVCMEKDFKKLNLAQIRKEWNSDKYKNRKKWDATTTGKGNMKNLPGVYRNLPDEYPLTARKQNRQFNSKGYIMSPRELGRIQGLPDSFKLWYDPNKDQYSINKSRVTATKCPPYELGEWFAKCLIKAKNKYNEHRKN